MTASLIPDQHATVDEPVPEHWSNHTRNACQNRILIGCRFRRAAIGRAQDDLISVSESKIDLVGLGGTLARNRGFSQTGKASPPSCYRTRSNPIPPLGPYPQLLLWGHLGTTPRSNRTRIINSIKPMTNPSGLLVASQLPMLSLLCSQARSIAFGPPCASAHRADMSGEPFLSRTSLMILAR